MERERNLNWNFEMIRNKKMSMCFPCFLSIQIFISFFGKLTCSLYTCMRFCGSICSIVCDLVKFVRKIHVKCNKTTCKEYHIARNFYDKVCSDITTMEKTLLVRNHLCSGKLSRKITISNPGSQYEVRILSLASLGIHRIVIFFGRLSLVFIWSKPMRQICCAKTIVFVLKLLSFRHWLF